MHQTYYYDENKLKYKYKYCNIEIKKLVSIKVDIIIYVINLEKSDDTIFCSVVKL
jgi:hypothetical protein